MNTVNYQFKVGDIIVRRRPNEYPVWRDFSSGALILEIQPTDWTRGGEFKIKLLSADGRVFSGTIIADLWQLMDL